MAEVTKEPLSNLKRYESDTDMYNRCSTVIELVDSDYWLVKTNIFEMEGKLIKRLNGKVCFC